MAALNGLSDAQIAEIGVNAYVYLYPLVTMDLTRKQMTNVAAGQIPGRGPMGSFTHIREFPAADFKVVVRPNFDTLYSSAWLDLRDGPVVMSAPADADGRYYELPVYDMWSDAFAVPGQRTSGTEAGSWALVPPGWSGELPEGVERVDTPTPFVWIIGRTQTNGPADYEHVHAFQDQLRLTPLATWPDASESPLEPEIDPTVDMTTAPLDLVNAMSAEEYFDYGLSLMTVNPPHLTDSPLLMQMRRLGLVAGARYEQLPSQVTVNLDGAPRAAQATMKEAFPRIARVVNGWLMNIDTMGVYGNFYIKRAIVTMIGLGANAAEDAVYPVLQVDADGRPLDGAHDYVLHFDQQELPPVDAFWSVTMYDSQGFQAANVLDRFAIGDRDALVYNADGSLDLYLQHESPGQDKESNWLPAPRGPLGVTMRLYAPQASVLHGTWNPPAVRRR